MAPRRITLDPRTVQTPRFADRRVLEPEVMSDESGVEAYLDGVATRHLGRLDDSFVRAALKRLAPGARVLDVGTGTAAIPVKMAAARSDLSVAGVDLSDSMLEAARSRIEEARLGKRVRVRKGGARNLPYRSRTFDAVVSNSLLHHLPDPVPAFHEMARVLKPGGVIFIRDLRRPGPSRMKAHIRRHGRFYRGEMLRLFADSVRAAFKVSEMRSLVEESPLAGCRVRPQFQTYLLIEGTPRARRHRRRRS